MCRQSGTVDEKVGRADGDHAQIIKLISATAFSREGRLNPNIIFPTRQILFSVHAPRHARVKKNIFIFIAIYHSYLDYPRRLGENVAIK